MLESSMLPFTYLDLWVGWAIVGYGAYALSGQDNPSWHGRPSFYEDVRLQRMARGYHYLLVGLYLSLRSNSSS